MLQYGQALQASKNMQSERSQIQKTTYCKIQFVLNE